MAAFLFLLVVATTYDLRLGYDADEAELLLQSQRIAHGQLPHRDYVYHYGSVPAYLNLAVGVVCGFDIGTFRALTIALGTIVAMSMQICAAPLVGTWWGLLPPVLYAFYGPRFHALSLYPTWYCLIFAFLAIYSLIRHVQSGSRAWVASAGAFCGLAFATKLTLGAFYLAAAAISLRLTARGRDEPFNPILDLVVGCAGLVSFSLFVSLVRGLAANFLVMVPISCSVLLLFQISWSRRAVGDARVLASGWKDMAILFSTFIAAQTLALLPFLFEEGFAGIKTYYGGVLEVSVRLADLPMADLNVGFPASPILVVILVTFMALIYSPHWVPESAFRIIRMIAALLGLIMCGALALTMSGHSLITESGLDRSTAYWTQTCVLLVPVSSVLLSLFLRRELTSPRSASTASAGSAVVLTFAGVRRCSDLRGCPPDGDLPPDRSRILQRRGTAGSPTPDPCPGPCGLRGGDRPRHTNLDRMHSHLVYPHGRVRLSCLDHSSWHNPRGNQRRRRPGRWGLRGGGRLDPAPGGGTLA